MLPKIWSLLLLGTVIYPFLSAKFCSRSYINGKWITEGDCGGAESMSQIMKELQLRAEDEKERTTEKPREADNKKNRNADKKWTVFQRRKYGNVSFYRGWNDYVNGFGDTKGDFWLGLETMHEITKEGNMVMKIKMISREGIYWVAKYSSFRIGPGFEKYRLHYSGYSGNATDDALASHNNQQFSTKDADHDDDPSFNCAHYREGGWWYGACGGSNLNGNFRSIGYSGIRWGGVDGDGWSGTSHYLRFTEMKFRKRL